MKNFPSVPLLFLIIVLIIFDAYQDYLKTYNTQQDRIMLQKTYELITNCRKHAMPNMSLVDKVCGEIPKFFNEVK